MVYGPWTIVDHPSSVVRRLWSAVRRLYGISQLLHLTRKTANYVYPIFPPRHSPRF